VFPHEVYGRPGRDSPSLDGDGPGILAPVQIIV
jgi:hypothetical protein